MASVDGGGSDEAADGEDALMASFQRVLQKRHGLQMFADELQKEDDDVDLFTAALWIAQHRNPDLDVQHYHQVMDTMVSELQDHLPPPDESYPLRMIKAINQYLYEVKGLKGNAENYYDPDNSCIDKVLDNMGKRNTGIPISLSCLYMELARRIDFPMVGVNLPAHFMIRPLASEVELLVDPFDEGKVLFVEDAEAMLSKHYGADATVKIERTFFQDNMVRPRNFLTRMLTNLKQIYFNEKNYDLALQVTEYQQETAPTEEVANFNRRDKGILYYLMQRYPEATIELQEYLKASPDAVDASRIEGIIEAMRMPSDNMFGSMSPMTPPDEGDSEDEDTNEDTK